MYTAEYPMTKIEVRYRTNYQDLLKKPVDNQFTQDQKEEELLKLEEKIAIYDEKKAYFSAITLANNFVPSFCVVFFTSITSHISPKCSPAEDL
jgi:hypothetical protein